MYFEISNPMDYKAALYIRLSKEDDNEKESQSVTNQRGMLQTFVDKYRIDVFDTYIDDGFSGTNFDRPGFKRMVSDIELGRVNMVITKDMSRLGRDYIETGYYMEKYFPENRVRYVSLLDGVDSGTDSSANDITPFRAVLNDMYAKDISKKIKGVKHDKQYKGLFIGGKAAFGYHLSPTEKNKIVVDEEAAAVVRRIFQLALGGTSCRQIAVLLNEAKVKTPAIYAGLTQGRFGPYTGKWSSERIADILQNQIYIGNMVQGKSKKVNYKSEKCIKMAKKDWIVVPNTHEPLINRETFDHVQLLVNSRKTTRIRTYDFLLKGLIFCHECGYPLAVLNRPNANCDTVLYFVCRTYQRFTKARVCTCHAIKEEVVTNAVLSKINEVCRQYLNESELSTVAERALKELDTKRQTEAEISTLGGKIDALGKKLDLMYVDKLSGLLEEDVFLRIYAKIKEERLALEEKRKHLMESQKRTPEEKREEIEALVKRFVAGAEHNRELLVSLIDRVELSEDKEIFIRFRFRHLDAFSRSPLQ